LILGQPDEAGFLKLIEENRPKIYFFTTPHFVARIGALILIGGDLFASWKIIQNRRSTPQPIADAPVMEWLNQQRKTLCR